MVRCGGKAAVRGFTLIELLVTVAIVALLSSIALPMTAMTAQRSKEQELRATLREIRTAIDAYKQAYDEGKFGALNKTLGATGYPPSLKVLAEGVNDPSNPKPGSKIYFLRRVPRDPFSTDSAIPAEDTWGHRSYVSPPNEPKEGDDVYDVYTKSNGVGLNGVPYRDW